MRTHQHLSMTGRAFALVGLLASALALPATAEAQRLATASVRVARPSASRADSLEERAAAIEDTHRDARELLASAELREAAARLRGPTDARSAEDLRLAAYGRHHAGDAASALVLLEAAAARSAELGDVAQAVASYLDAANVARELGQEARMRRNVEKARSLAGSPGLATGDREALKAAIARRFRS